MENYRWKLIELNKSDWPQEGKLMSFKIKNKTYCLGRINDIFFVLDNRCPHANGILSHGWINEKGQVVCPNHRYEYDPFTGKNTSGEGLYCEHYKIKEEENNLYIAFSKKKNIFNFLNR